VRFEGTNNFIRGTDYVDNKTITLILSKMTILVGHIQKIIGWEWVSK